MFESIHESSKSAVLGGSGLQNSLSQISMPGGGWIGGWTGGWTGGWIAGWTGGWHVLGGGTIWNFGGSGIGGKKGSFIIGGGIGLGGIQVLGGKNGPGMQICFGGLGGWNWSHGGTNW